MEDEQLISDKQMSKSSFIYHIYKLIDANSK